jgi:predicted glycosyltransferase
MILTQIETNNILKILKYYRFEVLSFGNSFENPFEEISEEYFNELINEGLENESQK